MAGVPVSESGNLRVETMKPSASKSDEPAPRRIFEVNGPWDRRARYLAFIPLVFAVLLGFYYVRAYGVNFFWSDSWDGVVLLFEEHAAGTLSLHSFWAPHCEHRHFFPRMVQFGTGLLTQGNALPSLYLTEFMLLGVLLSFLAAFRERFPSGWAMWLAAPAAFLVFSLRQYEMMLWEFELSFAMTIAATTLAFLCLSRMKAGWNALMFATAASAATIAAGSAMQGLLVWPIGLAQILIVSLDKRRKIVLASCWAVIGAAEWSAYFVNWSHPSGHPAIHFSPTYLIAMIGGAFFDKPKMAVAAGLLILALAGLAVVFALLRRQWAADSFWLAIMACSLATVAMITLGRSGFPLGQALASRYACFSIPLVLATYVLFIPKAGDQFRRTKVFGTCVVLVLMLLGVAHSLDEGLTAGTLWREIKLYGQTAICTTDSQSDAMLQLYYPRKDVLLDAIETMKKLKYGPFADADLCAKSQLLPPTAPVLPGTTQFAMQPPEGVLVPNGAVLIVQGWAVDWPADRKMGEPAGGVAVVIDGVAHPARYGIENAAAVQSLGDEKYRHSGFLCFVAVGDVGPGNHTVSLKIATQDRKAAFATPKRDFRIP